MLSMMLKGFSTEPPLHRCDGRQQAGDTLDACLPEAECRLWAMRRFGWMRNLLKL
jgi:hypothetical protein